MGNWKMLMGGLVVLAVLVTGIYVYACGSGDKPCDMDMSGGGHDKHSKSGQKADAAKTPENLIKQADKLLKEVDKTKDVKPLMTHCQEMLARSLTMMAECNRALKGAASGEPRPEGREKPDMAKLAGIVDTANKLMVKSTELTDKCLSLMPKPEKVDEKDEAKTLYVCPMGCIEPQAEPGKCPKCGMNLEKKK